MNPLPPKIKSPRNKTLSIDDKEKKGYEKTLLFPDNKTPLSFNDIKNKTICTDLISVLDYLPESFADLIIIDPPYNLLKDFHGFTFKASNHQRYLEYLQSWFPKIIKLLKPNGSLYCCGDWKSTAALQHVMEEHLTVINRITWQREKGRGALNNWKNGMEDIWFAVKNAKDYYFDVESVKMKRKVIAPYKQNGQPKDWIASDEGNFRLTYPSNFWDDITIPYWSMAENTDHPTQKPEKLIAKLILASCPVNGMVFDPFLGSGTSSVVAKKLGRNYVGIEMNRDYAVWAEKRLALAANDQKIQGYEEGVFWERNSTPASKNKNKI